MPVRIAGAMGRKRGPLVVLWISPGHLRGPKDQLGEYRTVSLRKIEESIATRN